MFQIISGQTFIMFLMILVGLIIFRTHLSDHEGNKAISNILLMVVTPAMLLQALISIEYRPELIRNLVLSIVLGFISNIVSILVTHPLLGKDRSNPDLGMERFLAVYSNCGFMGIPLVSAAYGNEAVLYLTGYMIAFNILIWTHGLIQMTGETSGKQLVKGLMSPAVIATVIGIVIFFFRIPVNAYVASATGYIGAMNTPLGMIAAGTALGETDFLGALKKKRLFWVCALKLIAAPLATLAVLLAIRQFIPVCNEVFYAILIPAACPAATTATMMALRYGGDYEYSSQVFVVSTLMSMITIPVVISLSSMITG